MLVSKQLAVVIWVVSAVACSAALLACSNTACWTSFPAAVGAKHSSLTSTLLDIAANAVKAWFTKLAQPSALLAQYPSLMNGEALQSLQPSVYGYVKKAGVADVLAWSQKPQYSISRKAVFEEWRQNNTAGNSAAEDRFTCAAAHHTPVPYPHCHVFVNHKYRVAYIRSPKSASTSIMDWMGQCRYNKTRNWNGTTCLQYSWEQYETADSIAEIWKDYFIFGFVRNPWNRAYSLYKDMTATNHFAVKHGPRCQMQWGHFCQNPFQRVQQLHEQGCTRVDESYSYWHMMDQYHCMITPTGEWAVDFLGRVEQGDEDWKVVVDEMNKRRLPGVQEVQYSSYGHVHAVQPGQQPPSWGSNGQQRAAVIRHHSNRRALQDAKSEQHQHCSDPNGPYCGANAHCIDAISRWYACDAEKFGYLLTQQLSAPHHTSSQPEHLPLQAEPLPAAT